MRCLIWLSLYVLSQIPAGAQIIDIYHSTIAENTVWDVDTVRIHNDLIIDGNVILTIKPGVVVEFQGHHHLRVLGNVVAEGTRTDSIHFVPLSTQLGWDGIIIEPAAYQDSTTFKFCVIRNATKSYYWNYSGSALKVDDRHTVSIRNSSIRNNQGDGYASPIFLTNSNAVIKQCTIANNNGYGAGGIFAYYGSPVIEQNRIVHNVSRNTGGGLSCQYASPKITGNYIAHNTATGEGGGIYLFVAGGTLFGNTIVRNQASSAGGIMVHGNGSLSLDKNTVAYNSANYGAGGITMQDVNGFSLTNSIVYFNSTSGAQSEVRMNYYDATGATISYCNIRGGLEGINSNSWYTFKGIYSNNIGVDPKFVDAEQNDFRLSWTSFPTPDASMSPCIDAGNPLDRHEPDGSVVDIGSQYFSQVGRNFPPRCEFSVDQRNGYKNLLVNFTSFVDPGNSEIAAYLWDFGDGATSAEANPTHEFTGLGQFDVSLTVTDKNGLSHQITKPAFIELHPNHYIEGVISGTFKKDEVDYFVGGDVFVPVGQKLVIEPGVKIIFGGWYKMYVNGTLIAQGTPADSITFTHYDTLHFGSTDHMLGGWRGIEIDDAGNGDSTIFEYCKIHFAKGEEGGALTVKSHRVRISRSALTWNKAFHAGGALRLQGSNAKINDNFIAYNSSGTASYGGPGGGIYCSVGVPLILRNIIYKNHAWSDGGGIYVTDGGGPMLINNVISNNSAQHGGGGIYNYSTRRYNLVNNTIISNSAAWGGGVAFYYTNRTDFFNCILHGNTPNNVNVNDTYTELGFRNCLVSGGKNSMSLAHPLSIFYYIKCIDANPNLAPTAEGFGRLLSTSPAIDKGYEEVGNLALPSTDIIGTPRILNNVIDIGAYEYAPLPSPELLVAEITLERDEDFQMTRVGLDSLFSFSLGNRWIHYSIVHVNTPMTMATVVNNVVEIHPLANMNGVDEFFITATNGETTVQTSVLININAVNDAPTITGSNVQYNAITGFTPIFVDISKLFDDVDNDLSGTYKIDNASLNGVKATLDGNYLRLESLPDQFGENVITISANDGEFTVTQNIYVFVSPILGEEADQQNLYKAFPNPTSHMVVVTFPDLHANVKVELCDSNGRILNVPQNMVSERDLSMNLMSVPAGLYFLHIRYRQKLHVIKLLKN